MKPLALCVLALALALATATPALADTFYLIDNLSKNFLRGDTANMPNVEIVSNLGSTRALVDLAPAAIPLHFYVADQSAPALLTVRESDGAIVNTLTLDPPMTSLGFDPATQTLYGTATSGAPHLYGINLSTGGTTDIGDTGLGGSSGEIVGMAFDPVTSQLFATKGSLLYRINPATGAATVVGNHGLGSPFGLAFNPGDGQLYVTSEITDSLYTINRSNAAVTLLGGPYSQGRFATGLAFSNIPSPGALPLLLAVLVQRRRRVSPPRRR